MIRLQPGTLVRTLYGELDTDEGGEERMTPAGEFGHQTNYFVASDGHVYWSLVFPNGAAVNPTEDELLDPNQYTLTAPADMAEPLVAAMRCYVESKLGEEVEIPGELT